MSLDSLQAAQERDLQLLHLFRLLWLYVGVFDFGGLLRGAHTPSASGTSGGAPPAWPRSWRPALGALAAASPVLVLGMEQQRGLDLEEQLRSEFGSRLAKLGQRGAPGALASALADLAGVQGPALSPPLASHLLTIASKVTPAPQGQQAGLGPAAAPLPAPSSQLGPPLDSPLQCLCRAHFSGPEAWRRREALPEWGVLAHMQLSLPSSSEYPWLSSLLQRVFAAHTARVQAARAAATDGAARDALHDSVQALAGVLAGHLVLQVQRGRLAGWLAGGWTLVYDMRAC